MGSNALLDDILDSSKDELQALEQLNVGIPECERLPRPMWNMKYVTLYNVEGILVGKVTCHSVNSELVLGVHGPLGDTHVSKHISKTHSEMDIPGEQVHSLVAWPITLVYCCRASLHNHGVKDNYNRQRAVLLNPPSSKSIRPYRSASKNPPCETTVKTKNLLTQQSINEVSSKVCCSQNCIQPFSREKIRAF